MEKRKEEKGGKGKQEERKREKGIGKKKQRTEKGKRKIMKQKKTFFNRRPLQQEDMEKLKENQDQGKRQGNTVNRLGKRKQGKEITKKGNGKAIRKYGEGDSIA